MAKVETMGITAMHIGLRTSLVEMKDWTPERVSNYFAGIAKMVRAAGANARIEVSEPLTEAARWSARREGLVPMQ